MCELIECLRIASLIAQECFAEVMEFIRLMDDGLVPNARKH